MADSPITLKAFFCDDAGKPIVDCLDAEVMMQAARDATGALPRAVLPGLRTAFGGAVDGLFEPRLDDILQRSWGKLQAVQETIKHTAADPAAIPGIPLLGHPVTLTQA